MLTIENIKKIEDSPVVVNGKVIRFNDVQIFDEPWYEYSIGLMHNKKYIGSVHIYRIKKVDFEGNPKYNISMNIDGISIWAKTELDINELKSIFSVKHKIIKLLEQLDFK